VTFYDDRTDERVELSAWTFDNWVAKTANLLRDDLAVEPGSTLSLDDLQTRCDGVLAKYKHPRRLVIVDAIPRTRATGQVQRSALVRALTDRPDPGRDA
jgi:acyl-CoA synthetase (AMP-forming)/AMP-acid ligase II